MMKMSVVTCGLGLAFAVSIVPVWASPAWADVVSDEVGACRGMDNAIERLVCYDDISLSHSGTTTPPVDDAPNTSGDVGNWSVSDDTDPMTDTPKVTMMLASDGTGYRAPSLFVRCSADGRGTPRVEVFIAWNDYLADNTVVTSRFDDTTPVDQTWDESSDKTATFARNASSWVGRFMASDQYIARIRPYNEGPVTAVFQLAGFEAASVTLRDACNLE